MKVHRSRSRRLALILTLLGAGSGAAQALLALRGQIAFFNDNGAFLLDLGNQGAGKTLGGKLSGVVTREGTADFVRKFIPAGATVVFTVVKKGAYPEGTITYAGHDLGTWLVSKKLATLVPKAP